jgi:hypothetical protein
MNLAYTKWNKKQYLLHCCYHVQSTDSDKKPCHILSFEFTEQQESRKLLRVEVSNFAKDGNTDHASGSNVISSYCFSKDTVF